MRALPWILLGLAACGVKPGKDRVPPDPPTQQDYHPGAPGTLLLTWHDPADSDFAATLLVRYDGDVKPDGRPSAGSTPREGEAFGSGRVVYVGRDGQRLDTLADGCGAVSYRLWSTDSSGNWSGGPAQLDVPRGAATVPPTAPVTALTAAAVDGDVQLAWTNPDASSGWSTNRVVRKAKTAPASPLDGIAVFSGSASSAAEPLAGMSDGPWVYAVFSCNACGGCNATPATVVFSAPVPMPDGGSDGGIDGGVEDGGTGSLTPFGLTEQLSGDGKNVLLSWTNPPGVNGVRVLRTLNAEPLGPGDSDAAQVFSGMATSAAERTDRLLPDVAQSPRQWHYRVYGCKNSSCESTGAGVSVKLTVAQALRGGGYTLFWRHSTANVCSDQTQLGPASTTTSPDWWKSCDNNCASATARQLDGVQAPNETATTHTVFAQRGFAVGKVMSSEFCRAMQTAQGFNFGPPIEPSQVLTYFVYDEGQRCNNTLLLLNTAPAAGTNTALVSHAGFTCPIIDSLAWGEAAIYHPAISTPLYIGRVTWNSWSTLP